MDSVPVAPKQHTNLVMSLINKALATGIGILLAAVAFKTFLAPHASFITEPLDVYDFIVVGAGSTGSVLASRLSEDYKVLLIEAGTEFSWTSRIPLGAPFIQGTENDWQYKTVPQTGSSLGLVDKISFWPRGKGLGGSGQMNYLVHYGGRKDDWEAMARVGVEGWGLTVMANYMAKLKGKSYRTEELQVVESNCHDTAAPLCLPSLHPDVMASTSRTVSQERKRLYITKEDPDTNVLLGALIGSSQELKHLKLLVTRGESTTKTGSRHTSLQSHLNGAMNRPDRLHVLLNTQVSRLTIKESQVLGVEIVGKNSEKKSVAARQEVIVSAGAVGTPLLLQRSGIGPKSVLEKYGIDVIADLPIGNNLHDHLNVPIYVSIDKPVSTTIAKILRLEQVLKYTLLGRGHLAKSGVAGTLTGGESGLLLFAIGSTEEKLFRVISNYKAQVFNGVFPHHSNHSAEGFVFLASCLRPRSRGYVQLASGDLNTHPYIHPNYLSDEYDITCTKNAIRLARRLVLTTPFQKLGAKMHLPVLDECLAYEPSVTDDAYLECLIRTTGITGYHAAGTVPMGNLSDSVLDNAFRFRDLKGVRVVDASVLPLPLLGAPNSVLLAMADRAANLILAETNTRTS